MSASQILCMALCAISALSQSAETTAAPDMEAVQIPWTKDSAFLSLASAQPSTDSTTAPNGDSSTSAPEEDSAPAMDLDYEKLAEFTMQSFLPKRVVSCVMAGLLVIKGVNDSIQSAFSSMPEAALFSYCALLGVFSFMTCQMYWGDSTRASLLSELGPWLTLSGLFAQSMLLITPLILLMPDQTAAMKLWQGTQFAEGQKKVTEMFQKSYVKQSLLWMYMVLVCFQVASVFSFWKLAELQQDAVAKNPAIQISKFEEQTGPYMTCLLYLVLAWCNVTAVYEYLFDVAFQQDFPRNVFRRMFGCAAVADQPPEQPATPATDALYQSIADSATVRDVVESKEKFVAQGQQLLDNIKAIRPNQGITFMLHFVAYQAIVVCVVLLVAALEYKMWETAGRTPLSISFLLLSCGLVCFAFQFGVFGACGVKGEDAPQPMMSAVAQCRVQESPQQVGAYRPFQTPEPTTGVGAKERALEKVIIKKFADILEIAFIWEDRAMVVPCKGKEDVVAARIGEIADFIQFHVLHSMHQQVSIMDSLVHAAISQAALGDIVRNQIIEHFFSKFLNPREMLVVDQKVVSEMARPLYEV